MKELEEPVGTRSKPGLMGEALRQRVAGLSPEGRRRLGAALKERREYAAPGERWILVAAVVPESNAQLNLIDAETLVAALAERLPAWMVPARVAALPAIPRSPNGKIDRKAVATAVSTALDGTTGSVDRRLVDWDAGPESARTRIEAAAARLMADVLGRSSLRLRDNFFELGGHSLLVAELTRRIRDTLGVDLPLRALFAAPTPERLAALVEEKEGGSRWPSLVGIRTGGQGPILFLVHGLGGGVFEYYRLGEHFPEGYRLYAVQAPMQPWSDLPAMAASYLGEVRKVQERGPYLLGGYCLGGNVAFEMTRQLAAAGEETALLALIESSPPAGAVHNPASLAPRIVQSTRRMAQGGPVVWVDTVRRNVRRLGRQVRRAVQGSGEGWRQEAQDVIDMSAYPEAYREAAAAHFRALRDYRAEPWPGKAWLFRSNDDKLAYLGRAFGWERLIVGGVRVERIPGDHHGTFQPGAIEVLAEGLSRALSEQACPLSV